MKKIFYLLAVACCLFPIAADAQVAQKFQLDWAYSGTTDGFRIYLKNPNGSYTKLADLGPSDRMYQHDVNGPEGSNWCFAVAAFNAGGESSKLEGCAIIPVTKIDPPAAPTNLKVTAVAPAPVPPPPPPVDPISFPTRQWFAYELPDTVPWVGVRWGAKHMTCAQSRRDQRIYCVGGDYNGGSYIQQVVSLSVAERLAAPNDPNAGWRLEFPRGKVVPSQPSGYSACSDPPQLGPKHPDFVGWFWDERIGKFWYVPGTEVTADDNCPGETSLAQSDPNFSWARIMLFDPATGKFEDFADAGVGHNKTWWSTLDPAKNRILRPWYHGGAGSSLDIFDIANKTWESKQLGPYNPKGGEPHLEHGYHTVDYAKRNLYLSDWLWLYRVSLETPIGSNGAYTLNAVATMPASDTEIKMVFDPHSRVILFPSNDQRTFNAFHVDAGTDQWENLGSMIANNGAHAGGKVLFYDEINNVLGWFGQSDPSPNLASTPYLFLYRYGPSK